MLDLCPSAEKCPIFSGILQGRDYTTKVYQTKYCQSGENGRNDCRRWQCKQKFGQVPTDLLPNSIKTVDDIGKENEWI